VGQRLHSNARGGISRMKKLFELDADLRQKRSAIVGFLEMAEQDLEKAQEQDNQESAVTYTFLVTEYQQMLEEFDDYYGIQTV
jgi:hypothetical protein